MVPSERGGEPGPRTETVRSPLVPRADAMLPDAAAGEPPLVALPPTLVHPSAQMSLGKAVALLLELCAPPRRKMVLLLAIAIFVVLIGNMFGQVRLNAWYGDFFDAIEQKNVARVGHQLLVFLAIVSVLLGLVVAQTWLREMLKLRLREVMTHRVLDDWLVPGRAYRLSIASVTGVNPDQRMQEDMRHASELSADLGTGLLHHVLLLVSFIGVLWTLSTKIALPIGDTAIVIPGYMVWCALIYAAAGSFLTWLVGRPLVRLNVVQYQREAELRFALVRVSESAESIALYNGESDERRIIDRTVSHVIEAMRRVTFALARLTWITSGYGWLAIVVPTVVALPGYFYGGLGLGGLMMVVGAFDQVQQALRWFVDHYAKIAEWHAALHRVSVFHEALRTLDDVAEDETRIELADHPTGWLAFENVAVLLADGSVIIKDASAEIRPGERVLIVGESGSGKSTLFRAIAGLWPWGTGKIMLPPRETMMFMPQRPYLPLGTLRAAVTYPAAPDAFSGEAIVAALERVGLAEFVPVLDHEERWDRSMSIGQQQRLAFARLFLHAPRWVFLDEATAALDEESQSRVMSLFDRELVDTALVSIGHRPGLERFHARTMELVTSTSGARLRRKRSGLPGPKGLRAFLGGLYTANDDKTKNTGKS